jgi:hypothetical protein
MPSGCDALIFIYVKPRKYGVYDRVIVYDIRDKHD